MKNILIVFCLIYFRVFRTELFLETVIKKNFTKNPSKYIVINIIEKFNMAVNTLLEQIFVILFCKTNLYFPNLFYKKNHSKIFIKNCCYQRKVIVL